MRGLEQTTKCCVRKLGHPYSEMAESPLDIDELSRRFEDQQRLEVDVLPHAPVAGGVL